MILQLVQPLLPAGLDAGGFGVSLLHSTTYGQTRISAEYVVAGICIDW